jgi:hypothetical protein
VIALRALTPKPKLSVPLVSDCNAWTPTATLLPPWSHLLPAFWPTKTLLPPLVSEAPAAWPRTVLLLPVAADRPAPAPNASLLEPEPNGLVTRPGPKVLSARYVLAVTRLAKWPVSAPAVRTWVAYAP